MDNNIETEEWRDIEGYEGLYQISSLGRVRGCDRYVSNGNGIRLFRGMLLKPQKTTKGYLQVGLSKNGKTTIARIHRLVAKAFSEICGQFRNGLAVDHINAQKQDNRAINLKWCTPRENSNNPITKEHMEGENSYWFGKLGKEHVRSIPIVQYDLQGKFIAEFEGLADAERKIEISSACICRVLKGQRNHTHGYIFRYKTT